MDEAIEAQAATWAARTVARYAQSAEPELSPTEQEDLHKTLTAALRVAMHNRAAPGGEGLGLLEIGVGMHPA